MGGINQLLNVFGFKVQPPAATQRSELALRENIFKGTTLRSIPAPLSGRRRAQCNVFMDVCSYALPLDDVLDELVEGNLRQHARRPVK